MREIKFRAFATKRQEMIDLKKLTPLALDKGVLDEGDGLFIPFRSDIILMQFTGLKDKNGKEIYEGDIVKCEGAEVVIEFRGGQFIGINCDKNSPVVETQNRNWNHWEIIGNIYENKDLLK